MHIAIRTMQILACLALLLLPGTLLTRAGQAAPADYPPDPVADILWTTAKVTVADVQTAFNLARQAENVQLGTSLPMLSLPGQAAWDALSDGQKALWLVNRERVDRSLNPLSAVETSVTAVAQTFAEYLLVNNLFSHAADGRTPWQRLADNPAIGACHDFLNVAENLYARMSSVPNITLPVESAVYDWLYDDSGSLWGHRQAILWYPYAVQLTVMTTISSHLIPPALGVRDQLS